MRRADDLPTAATFKSLFIVENRHTHTRRTAAPVAPFRSLNSDTEEGPLHSQHLYYSHAFLLYTRCTVHTTTFTAENPGRPAARACNSASNSWKSAQGPAGGNTTKQHDKESGGFYGMLPLIAGMPVAMTDRY